MQTQEIYTVAQLAERWECSRDVVYDLARLGKLRCFKVGKAVRFTAEAVSEFENQ